MGMLDEKQQRAAPDVLVENNGKDDGSTEMKNETAPTDVDFSDVDEKKVLRKMDIRLIPMLSLLYLLAFLDRGNIGNAKIEGLDTDLGLTGPQYNWCCTLAQTSFGSSYLACIDADTNLRFCSNRFLLHLCSFRSAIQPLAQAPPTCHL